MRLLKEEKLCRLNGNGRQHVKTFSSQSKAVTKTGKKHWLFVKDKRDTKSEDEESQNRTLVKKSKLTHHRSKGLFSALKKE